jgi:hypothetical protein
LAEQTLAIAQSDSVVERARQKSAKNLSGDQRHPVGNGQKRKELRDEEWMDVLQSRACFLQCHLPLAFSQGLRRIT